MTDSADERRAQMRAQNRALHAVRAQEAEAEYQATRTKEYVELRAQQRQKRPQAFDVEIAGVLCDLISASAAPLVRHLEDSSMPSRVTFFRWLRENPTFAMDYAEARRRQADFLMEETIEIADTPMIGERTEDSDKNGSKVIRFDNVERSRLRTDIRRWAASRLNPKKYGDRVALTGAEDAPPIAIESLPAADPQQAMEVYLSVVRGVVKPMLEAPAPIEVPSHEPITDESDDE